MHALIIKDPYLSYILDGKKTWEIRATSISRRGTIALILSGSGKIYGTCKIVDVIGPLSRKDLRKNVRKHRVPLKDLSKIRYKKPYAWVLCDAKRYSRPRRYVHPRGAITWVDIGKKR